MPRIATVHLLIDVEDDGSACDFLSETLGRMPFLLDWGYLNAPNNFLSEATANYLVAGEYQEGEFLSLADILAT